MQAAVTGFAPGAVLDARGGSRPADAVVLATGFLLADGMVRLFRGRAGATLEEAWRAANNTVAAYKCVAVAGFPNLWLVAGPFSGSGESALGSVRGAGRVREGPGRAW